MQLAMRLGVTMRPLVLAVVLGVTPLFWGCGGEGTTSQRSLAGEVLDAASGAGISGASVEFVSDTLERAETTTDDDGRFTLTVDVTSGVELGHVTARHPRYAPAAAASVYFDATTQRSTVTIELSAKGKE